MTGKTYWMWHLGTLKLRQKRSTESSQTGKWQVSMNSNSVSRDAPLIRPRLKTSTRSVSNITQIEWKKATYQHKQHTAPKL